MTIPVIGAGLGATLGSAEEDTWAVYTAPDSFVQFVSETLKKSKKQVTSEALNGTPFQQAARRVVTSRAAAGGVNLELQSRSIGRWLQYALMDASPTVAAAGTSTTAKVQTFVPGTGTGMSLSVQVGRPTSLAQMQAFTYPGAKVTDWTLSVGVDAISPLQLTLDAQDEVLTDSYAAPSWIQAAPFHFAEASVLLGGTASTTSGVTKVTGGTKVAGCTAASIKGTNALDAARQFVGNAGLKDEQLINGFTAISGELDLEFQDTTSMYAAFAADTQTTLQLTWVGPVIDEPNSISAGLTVLLPAIFFDDDSVNADGPKILQQKGTFTALADALGNPAVQFQYTTLDTTPL